MDIALIVPFIIAIVAALNMVGIPKRFSPICALVLGVAVTYFAGDGEMATKVFEGLIAGLTASGLWSATRTTMNI